MLKEFLSQKGVAYEEHDVTKESLAIGEVQRLTGQTGVPVTVVDGQVVVGFDQARIEQLMSQAGAPERPKFGAAIADAVKYSKEGAPTIVGAYVGRLKAGSVAEKLGLVVGDVIIQVGITRISNAGDFEQACSAFEAGSQISVVFVRGSTVMSGTTAL